VLGDAEHRRHPVDAIRIARIHADLRVVERSRVAKPAAALSGGFVPISERPRSATVGRAIDAAVRLLSLARIRLFTAGEGSWQRVSFDPSVNDLRIGWRHRNTNASFRGLGEAAAFDLAPRRSRVSRFPKSAARAAA